MGVLLAGIHHISDEIFLSAAKTLADLVTNQDIQVGRMYPPLSSLKQCSIQIGKYECFVCKRLLISRAEHSGARIVPLPLGR